ncbi:YciI family protein [Pseudoduganella namucuonensis]|uniref:YCII-related domain-containing protein n=1 Tax=Pseudoduganella namucuonensis TaxID=1035707 RepID=A0A1I7LDR6_9BURK|nr:YciI family protein [Pseudoduganella namucuonensis]SFV07840.1 hypothetical protein SAMN05216552_102752 [Pseudoduganella namucuonensis]
MAYMIYQLDDQAVAVGEAELARHISYINALGPRVRMGGPLFDEAASQPKGRLIVADFDTRAEAEAFVAGDPFRQSGRIKTVTIERMSIL